jgi:hypothetical protein
MQRFDLFLGPNVDTFSQMLVFLGAKKVTKAISGNTTHAVSLCILQFAAYDFLMHLLRPLILTDLWSRDPQVWVETR